MSEWYADYALKFSENSPFYDRMKKILLHAN